MVLDAFDNAPAVRGDDARLVEMHCMIKNQVRLVCALRCAHQQVLDVPLSLSTITRARQQQAYLELGMRIEKVPGILECRICRHVFMAIRTKSLMLLDEFRRFVVLEVTARTTRRTEHLRRRLGDMQVDSVASHAGRIRYALKGADMTGLALRGYR